MWACFVKEVLISWFSFWIEALGDSARVKPCSDSWCRSVGQLSARSADSVSTEVFLVDEFHHNSPHREKWVQEVHWWRFCSSLSSKNYKNVLVKVSQMWLCFTFPLSVYTIVWFCKLYTKQTSWCRIWALDYMTLKNWHLRMSINDLKLQKEAITLIWCENAS